MKRQHFSVIALGAVIAACIFAAACSSAPIDPRSAMPADALIYIETRDLGTALSAVIENPKFKEAAASVPNIEALMGIKVSVAVTGFETKETKENGGSVLDLHPHFVAVAETNAWNFQARGFVEDRLDGIVKNSYGEKTKLNRVGKYDGDLYEWAAADGRRSYALVIGSAVYFSNDIAAMEKCLSVQHGEQTAIAVRPEFTAPDELLASGYISEDGIAQIANLLGVSAAMNTGEDADVQSFVARVLPQAVRRIAGEISWSAKRTDGRIEDEYRIKLKDGTAAKAAEAFSVLSGRTDDGLYAFVPKDPAAATRYDIADPKKAWNAAVEITREHVDPVSANLINIFSATLFEPYGIADPDGFLENIDGSIVTVKLRGEDESAAFIASVKDVEKANAAFTEDIRSIGTPERTGGAEIRRSEDGEIAAAFFGNVVIAGSSDAVEKCLGAKRTGENIAQFPGYQYFHENGFSAVTAADVTDAGLLMFEAFGGAKDDAAAVPLYSVTRTSYDADGMRRVVVSDFGLIGDLIARFADE